MNSKQLALGYTVSIATLVKNVDYSMGQLNRMVRSQGLDPNTCTVTVRCTDSGALLEAYVPCSREQRRDILLSLDTSDK
jgi:hypothetical protein